MALKEVQLANWSGGLNTRDQPSELASDEFPDASNVTIDERGALMKRLGYERRFAAAVGSGKVSNMFDWKTRGFLVEQIGAGMHVNNGAAFLTWSTTARCGMCEFNGDLVLIHPVDGVRVYDGTTVTGPFANSPLGDTVATWQNKVFAAGNPSQPSRVTRSNIATHSTWSVNDWTDLKEKDSSKVIWLGGASGLDVSGRPGLIAFKADSAYRIYDSSTGAYNTIDASIGCGSNIGAVSAYGRVYAVSPRGIYYTDGIGPMIEASNKLENLFQEDQINQARGDLYCAGRYQDRLWFSLPRAGETANSISLEHHPHSGWTVKHTNAASCYSTFGGTNTNMIFASPSVDGMIYNSHTGGSDDGAAITCYFQTGWVEPNFGNKTRIRRLRIRGMGEFDVTLYKDYELGSSFPTRHVEIVGGAAIYDDPVSLYDDPTTLYGPGNFEDHQDFWSIGVVRSFSLRVDESSTTVLPGRDVLGVAQNEQSAFLLTSASLLTIDLGFH